MRTIYWWSLTKTTSSSGFGSTSNLNRPSIRPRRALRGELSKSGLVGPGAHRKGGELPRILLPCTPVNSPFGFASHGEDDFPSSVPFCQIPYGLRSLGERVGPVDDRCELAGFDELLEQDKVLAVLSCDERPQLLAHEPGQYRRPQLAIGASEPPSSPFAPDDDEGSLRGKDATEARQRRVPADVQDQVIAPLA